MSYHFKTVGIILIASLAYSPAVYASRCLKSAEKQAISTLKKSGHADSLHTKNTFLVKLNDEIQKAYHVKVGQELFSTEMWEDDLTFAVYDVLVETETCQLRMVRAGGL